MTRRLQGMNLRLSLALGLLAMATLTIACCVAMPAGTYVQLSNEDVIIVWDKTHGVEHFIRQAKFTSDQKNFGFIVPTPSLPTLSKVDKNAFEDLRKLIPVPETRDLSRGNTMAMAASKSIEVLQEVQVGSYLATTVKATDGQAMAEWLAVNGFAQRPAMTEWLDFYAKRNWTFTALKYNMPGKPADRSEQNTEAIRLSFKSDRPHYPYKMPTDTWPGNYYRPMRVYFVSTSPVQAKYEGSGKPWEANTTFTGRIDDETLRKLAFDLNLNDSDMPGHATLTVFDNGDNPDGYGEDLVFHGTQSYLWAVESGLALLVVFGIMYFRRRPRKVEPMEQKAAA